jgi:hypothetical protein
MEVGFCVYDICKSIVEVNDGDIGKVSGIHYIFPLHQFLTSTNTII